jgi:hypothetical protein
MPGRRHSGATKGGQDFSAPDNERQGRPSRSSSLFASLCDQAAVAAAWYRAYPRPRDIKPARKDQRMILPRALTGLLAASIVAMPWAASAKDKPAKAPKELQIENARKVALLTFEIVVAPADTSPKTSAKPAKPQKPVLKLEKPLQPGEKTTAKISGAKGCAYLVRWTFEDAGDEGPIDLCHDPKIVLTD